MSQESGEVSAFGLEGRDPGEARAIALTSNLTPLAKEFTPSGSSANGNTNKKQGAVKKGTYWNRDYRYHNGNRQQYGNYEGGSGSSRFYEQNSESFTNKSRNFSRNNYFKDFNRSSKQNKKFLEQTRNPESFSETNYLKNHENNGNFTQSEPDVIKYNNKHGYSSDRRSYKNSYKKNYNEYDGKSKEGESFTRRYDYNFKSGGNKKHTNTQDTENEERRIILTEKKSPNYQKNFMKKLDAASQRERLEQLITCRLLECLVCCEKLRHTDQIWSCKQCFHILHLQCVRRWALSSKLQSGWRCPACQNVYETIPQDYFCYCGKRTNPFLEPGGTPHSCGDVCSRKGRNCSHKCTILCHPGPCPDCSIMVPRSCGCGAAAPIVKCSSTVPIVCKNPCKKLLECGLHMCEKKCHINDCEPCAIDIKQECFCGKEGRKIKCTPEVQGVNHYSCGEPCGKLLSCGNHSCENICHLGLCEPCSLDPTIIATCPCGQTKLINKRNSCLDPIPCCDKKCNKKLPCGQPAAPHLCKFQCHEGPCPQCSLTTIMRCRCGHMDKEISCSRVTTKADDARCEKKCTKKRLCGKHKCNQFCCIEVDHICPLPCNRLLSCGQHKCEQPCHKGRCPPCWRSSFEELYCECGATVLYPPVACGTRPPPCDQPCSRPRSCDHEVFHSCHTGPCPPCTVLTKRWCHGQHEQRSTIPCHQETFSCGLPCGRNMVCGKHKCIQPCHTGPCRTPCTQPCSEPRPMCGHPCNQLCHDPPCPETSCKKSVMVTCQCGLRKSTRVCVELVAEYQSIAMAHLASKMEEIQHGYSVDVSDLVNAPKKVNLKILECNDDCRILERNRRLAIGLQIRNPDISAKLTPRYSDYMRSWAKKDPKFCKHIHDKLTELVQLAKQSKQKSRSYSFESMNRDKRHFVHEYCEHFGCESAAYDPEPNRNVVATAFRDKSWLPSYSLLEIIQRESGQRKVPGPQQLGKVGTSKVETVSLKLPGRIVRPPTPPGEYVDYFNNPPE